MGPSSPSTDRFAAFMKDPALRLARMSSALAWATDFLIRRARSRWMSLRWEAEASLRSIFCSRLLGLRVEALFGGQMRERALCACQPGPGGSGLAMAAGLRPSPGETEGAGGMLLRAVLIILRCA